MIVPEQLAEWKGLLIVSFTACLPSSKGPEGEMDLRTASPEASLLPASSCRGKSQVTGPVLGFETCLSGNNWTGR